MTKLDEILFDFADKTMTIAVTIAVIYTNSAEDLIAKNKKADKLQENTKSLILAEAERMALECIFPANRIEGGKCPIYADNDTCMKIIEQNIKAKFSRKEQK